MSQLNYKKILQLSNFINKILDVYFNYPEFSLIKFFKKGKFLNLSKKKIEFLITELLQYSKKEDIDYLRELNYSKDIEDLIVKILLNFQTLIKKWNLDVPSTTFKIINQKINKRSFYQISNEHKELISIYNHLSKLKHYFFIALLNGSIGSRDYKIGWSDIDIFIILRDINFYSKEKLIKTLSIIKKINKSINRYNILQQHGIFISTQSQLPLSYNQILPLQCVKNGDLFTIESELGLLEIDNNENEINYFLEIVFDAKNLYYMSKIYKISFLAKVRYLHRIFSFPFGFLQCFNIYTYKRDSFQLLFQKYGDQFSNIRRFYKFTNNFYENWKIKKLNTYKIRRFLSKFIDLRRINKFFIPFEFEIVQKVNTFFDLLKKKGYLNIFDDYIEKAIEIIKAKYNYVSKFNLPFENEEFYFHCQKKVIQVFSKIDGVLAIYKFGEIKAIGNSDLDLCFIIDNEKTTILDILNIFNTKFEKSEKYIVFQHTPWILTEDLFTYINIILPCKDLTMIFKQKNKKYRSYELNDPLIKLIVLVELLCTYRPIYPRPNSIRRDRFRVPLQIVNSLKYILKIYFEVCSHFNIDSIINETQIKIFIRKNNAIRRSMFIYSASVLNNHISVFNEIYIKILDLMKENIANLIKTNLITFPNNFDSLKNIGNTYFVKNYNSIYKIRTKFNFVKAEFNPIEFYHIITNSNLLSSKIREKFQFRNEIIQRYINFTKILGNQRIYTPFYVNRQKNQFTRLFFNIFNKKIISRIPTILIIFRDIFELIIKKKQRILSKNYSQAI